mmetsp:Transcript_89122/g.191229  ORF Transcript_89122/g.191229 Transcript_89122/m.191229 type:complete len:319 (+) Transcript_89122:122-1078(+)
MMGLRSLILRAALLICAVGADPSSTCEGLSLLQKKSKPVVTLISVSQAQAASQQLAIHLAKVARAKTTESSTSELLHSFRICGNCEHFKRFGELHDGGYLTCMDGLAGGNLKAAYSLGVEHHDQWSDDVGYELAVKVNQFDCTVSEGPPCSNCQFFPKCIRSESGSEDAFPGQSVTLNKALELSGQKDAAQRSLLLKIDIEGSEWPIFADESKELLQKFQQIIVEFHSLDKVDKHPQYLKAVQNILHAGFRVAHLHGNNYAGMFTEGENRIPDVLEVTYISTGGGSEGSCSDEQVFLADDAPNNPGAPELDGAELAGV